VSAWLLHALATGALAALTAWAAEQVLRALRRPARMVWIGALVVTLGVPLAMALRPAPVLELQRWEMVLDDSHTPPSSVTPVPLLGTAPRVEAESLLALWSGGSLLLLGVLLGLQLRLHRRRRSWEEASVDGVRVRISEREGPAVIGWRRPEIVLPRWLLTWPESRRRLVLAHEMEHLRASDPLLLLAGLLACVAFPWNPVVWWQLHRLRLAIEMDCDQRVLRSEEDARRYALLLLDVGRRAQPALAVAFSEHQSLLERRIRMITRPAHRGAAALAGFAALLLAAPLTLAALPLPEKEARWVSASATSLPPVAAEGRPEEAGAEYIPEKEVVVPRSGEGAAGGLLTREADAAAGPDPSWSAPMAVTVGDTIRPQPVFTPYEQPPELRNPAVLQEAVGREYTATLRGTGASGRAVVWLYVDAEGTVRDTRIHTSSGHGALDDAALRVLRGASFVPARNRGEPVAVWVTLPLAFGVQGVAGTGAGAPTRAGQRALETQRAVSGPATPERRAALIEMEEVGTRLVEAQERYLEATGAYAASLQELGSLRIPPRVSLSLTAGRGQAGPWWAAVATHPDAPASMIRWSMDPSERTHVSGTRTNPRD
jgi:TonB family protein